MNQTKKTYDTIERLNIHQSLVSYENKVTPMDYNYRYTNDRNPETDICHY